MVTMLVLDACWLSLNLTSHIKLFESIQHSPLEVRLIPAVLIYILMPASATYFSILPSRTLTEAVKRGGALGLASFGLYDLTNMATLSNWTYTMLIKDTLWGIFVTATASGVGFYFGK